MSVNVHQAYNNCNRDYWSDKRGVETLEIGRTHECLLFRGKAEDISRSSRRCKFGQGFVILVLVWQLANEKRSLRRKKNMSGLAFSQLLLGIKDRCCRQMGIYDSTVTYSFMSNWLAAEAATTKIKKIEHPRWSSERQRKSQSFDDIA